MLNQYKIIIIITPEFSECVKKYLEDDGLDHPDFTKTLMDEFPDEPAYKKCKNTLNSSAKLESLVVNCSFLLTFFFFSFVINIYKH